MEEKKGIEPTYKESMDDAKERISKTLWRPDPKEPVIDVEKQEIYIHSVAEEISIIMDKYDVSCPLERQEVINEINQRFIDTKNPQSNNDTIERIICAAIWYFEGKPTNSYYYDKDRNKLPGLIIPCLNHDFSLLIRLYPEAGPFTDENTAQGFLTSKRRFVDRKEGSEIAFDAGQIKKDTGYLYSEDLY